MSIYFFPKDSSRYVQLPIPEQLPCPGPPGSTPGYDVVFPSADIDVFIADRNADAADAGGFFPVVAAYLNPPGIQGPPCEGVATIYVDGLLSRCAVYLNRVEFLDPTQNPLGPCLVDYRIKVAGYGISSTLYQGSFLALADPVDPRGQQVSPRGLLAEVSGVLGTQFELWARVNADAEGTNPQGVRVRIQFAMDRLGSAAFAYPGDASVGGGGLPVLPVVP